MNRSDLNTAIFGRLAGGTALTTALGGTAVYFQVAPEGKALPYVVFDWASRLDENESPHRTVNMLAYIRAYASTPVQASALDAEIDTLMHNKPLTITGVSSNFWCAREMSFDLVEGDPSTRKVYSCGAEYRIRIDI